MDTHESTTEASANQLLRDVMNMRKEAFAIVFHEYNTNLIAWMLYYRREDLTSQLSKVTSKASTAAEFPSDNSIFFDVDTGAKSHHIPSSEAHKFDHYSTDHTANNTEDKWMWIYSR